MFGESSSLEAGGAVCLSLWLEHDCTMATKDSTSAAAARIRNPAFMNYLPTDDSLGGASRRCLTPADSRRFAWRSRRRTSAVARNHDRAPISHASVT